MDTRAQKQLYTGVRAANEVNNQLSKTINQAVKPARDPLANLDWRQLLKKESPASQTLNNYLAVHAGAAQVFHIRGVNTDVKAFVLLLDFNANDGAPPNGTPAIECVYSFSQDNFYIDLIDRPVKCNRGVVVAASSTPGSLTLLTSKAFWFNCQYLNTQQASQ